MIRFLIRTAVALVASALGFIVSAAILDGFALSVSGFLIAVLIFTGTTALMQPFVMKTTMRSAQALMGASALVSTFIGLLVTDLVSDGVSISGLDTWLFATLLVWLTSMLAMFIIPFILVKMGVESLRENRNN